MAGDLEAQFEQARIEYERDGAAVLRNVVPLDQLAELAEAIDAMMAGGEHGHDRGNGPGRFFGDLFSTLHQPVFAKFMRNAGLAGIAGQVMRSQEVRFFYDQLLVKEPGTPARTPWHQDLPYWPAKGEQVLSTWVPVDAATPESGVVTYVKGSHLWHKFFPMQSFADADEMTDVEPGSADAAIYDRTTGPGKRTLSDVRDHPEHYEFLAWDVEPGDVILHHPLTVHGAPGNVSRNQRRRALALRWFGDDIRWDDSRPHSLRRFRDRADFPYPSLQTVDRIEDPLFPLVWAAGGETRE